MNDEFRTIQIPIPKKRTYFAFGAGDWTLRTLTQLARIRPEKECIVVDCPGYGAKRTVKRIHSLGTRYGFKPVCRTMRDNTVLVWVRKPGIDKKALKLWEIK